MTFNPSSPFVLCCSCGGMKTRAANVISKAGCNNKIPFYNGKEANALGIRTWLKNNGYLSVIDGAKHGSFAYLISPEQHGSVNLLSNNKKATEEGIQYVLGKQ